MQRKPPTSGEFGRGEVLPVTGRRRANEADIPLDRHAARRRGAAAVEMALVLIFLMTLTIGTMQFAWIFLVRHGMLHACREGARAYGKHDATAAEVVARTQTTLTELFSADHSGDFTVASNTTGTDRIVTVTISSSTPWVSFGDVFGFMDSQPTLRARAIFRDEGNY